MNFTFSDFIPLYNSRVCLTISFSQLRNCSKMAEVVIDEDDGIRYYGIKRRRQRKVIMEVLQFNHFTKIRGCLFYSGNTNLHSCNC